MTHPIRPDDTLSKKDWEAKWKDFQDFKIENSEVDYLPQTNMSMARGGQYVK